MSFHIIKPLKYITSHQGLSSPFQARPSNHEKNILEGKEANLSGVRLSTCSARSIYFGLASLNRRMSRFGVNDDDLIPEEIEKEEFSRQFARLGWVMAAKSTVEAFTVHLVVAKHRVALVNEAQPLWPLVVLATTQPAF